MWLVGDRDGDGWREGGGGDGRSWMGWVDGWMEQKRIRRLGGQWLCSEAGWGDMLNLLIYVAVE